MISAGNVRAHKRPDFFLELAASFPDVDFTWFGEGELRPSLIADAKWRHIGNVAFPGSLAPADLAREMASADVFVLPSLAEGVPKVTQEAAAAGLPQVIFGFYEAPTVVDGVNGFAVWSDGEFKRGLGKLTADRALRGRMGRAGLEGAQASTWEDVAPLWEHRIIAAVDLAMQPATAPLSVHP